MVSSLLFWFTTTVSATWYQGKEFGNNEEVDNIIGHRYSWSSIRFFCYVTSPNEEEAMRSESILSTHFYAIKVGGEAPVLLWLLFCLMSQKREHLFIHFYAFSFFNFIHDIHDFFLKPMKTSLSSTTTRFRMVMAKRNHQKDFLVHFLLGIYQ